MTKSIYDKIFINGPEKTYDEIIYIVSLITDDFNPRLFKSAFNDTLKIFSGNYNGYRQSNTKYHDIDHTLSVTLTTARLMHGCMDDVKLSSKDILTGLISALFHDVGLIQTDDDTEGTGAKYTVGHEQRSVNFMNAYLTRKRAAKRMIADSTKVIESTILSLSPKDFTFRNEEIYMLGKIVGSADLLGQVADRNYFRKLFSLYLEFKEAGVPGYDSELDLIKKTESFYANVVKKRLVEDLDNVACYMINHLKKRWGTKKDIYQQSIADNFVEIKKFLTKIESGKNSYEEILRDEGINLDK
ncbi:MAG: HD domain-containing protein [Desulfobacterales bacterium]|nr:HD domain-containing protein [Desulfobacterales bacterium]MCP4163230.1 HD domain-containing protein [Deltaproteobacteria bacterium]